MNTIKLADMLDDGEMLALIAAVKSRKTGSVHNCIMNWLDRNPKIVEKWVKLGLLPAYGAYVAEYHLQLT